MLKDTIKKLRTEQGLSQDELAERIHVVRQTVSKWERGTSVPDADSLVALARALGVSAAELLGESAMAEKKPDDLAWETSLLDERITSESQRLDRLVRSLKWVFVGAGGYGAGLRTFRLAAKPAVLIRDMVGQRGRRPGLLQDRLSPRWRGEVDATFPGSRGS